MYMVLGAGEASTLQLLIKFGGKLKPDVVSDSLHCFCLTETVHRSSLCLSVYQ